MSAQRAPISVVCLWREKASGPDLGILLTHEITNNTAYDWLQFLKDVDD